jgi:hypothetical protein
MCHVTSSFLMPKHYQLGSDKNVQPLQHARPALAARAFAAFFCEADKPLDFLTGFGFSQNSFFFTMPYNSSNVPEFSDPDYHSCGEHETTHDEQDLA